MTARRPATYWDYIRVEELLALQGGLDGDERALTDDEVRFIVIHQIDELWMKVAIRELATARDLFRRQHVPETALSSACAGLERIALIFDLMAGHFRLMETMRTRSYLEFRDKLSPASGFQSAQMREIEILLGLEPEQRIPFGHEDSYLQALREYDGSESPALRRVLRRIEDRPSLKDAVYAWLARAPIDGSSPGQPGDDEAVTAFVDAFLTRQRAGQEQRMQLVLQDQARTPADVARLQQRYAKELDEARAHLHAEDVQSADDRRRVRRLRTAILYIESHRELPLLSWPGEILDALIHAEQSMIVFRQRHARMVERVIGRRVGTGGSDGVDYLDRTALDYRVFREIWAARTMLLRSDLAPAVHNAGYYGLRAD
ncbi:MAG: tryptophan 2,3-dioxygenase [Planctomycetes bacterium]|nr:tryptophan 2,3-dioxygenase [Planctomycetota bacterium]